VSRKSLNSISFKESRTPVLNHRVHSDVAEEMRFMTDCAGKIIYTNDALADKIGLSSSDLQNRSILDTVFFKDLEKISQDRKLFNQAAGASEGQINLVQDGLHELLIGSTQEPHKFYFNWMTGQDDRQFLVASSMSPDTSTKDWTSLVDSIEDISAEEKNNKTKTVKNKKPVSGLAKTDEAFFATISQDVLCVLSDDGIILRHNGILDRVSDQLDDNTPFLDCVHADDKALVRQYLQSFNHDDDQHDVVPVVFECRMNDYDDHSVVMNWTIQNYDSCYFCIGRDVTTSHNNTNALNKIQQELSEAQALANMGHWRWTVGAEKIEWSDQIYKIFGVERGEFIPTLDNANARLHKRDVGHMTQAFQRAIIEQNDYDVEFRVIHDDGSVRYVQCEGRCDLDEDGDVKALYGIMQDVTPQTENEMALRHAKESAEHAYASKSRFLANMSHELRTPLNAIIGFSDMIKRQMLGPLGNDKYMEYADSIHNSGEHLLSLITDILDMSKIEAGKYDLDLETIQLGDVVTNAIRMIESRANEGVITLHNEIQETGPDIIADRRAVMQIMLNLLSNAVKFTEPGGEITVTIAERENHVSVKIIDTGIGIPANKLSAVLKPFEQVSTAFTRNHEGSGLGLTITKELAEMHGGLITLESKEGHGTTALLRLPRDASQRQSHD
jgi:two-component system cell cycle sensor histidine kinase PleC